MKTLTLVALRLAFASAFVTASVAFLVGGVYNGLVLVMAIMLVALLATFAEVRSFVRYMVGREDAYGRRISVSLDVLAHDDRS